MLKKHQYMPQSGRFSRLGSHCYMPCGGVQSVAGKGMWLTQALTGFRACAGSQPASSSRHVAVQRALSLEQRFRLF